MTVKPLVYFFVQLLVSLPPFPIFIGLFEHRDGQHEEQRCQVRDEETNSERLKELTQAHQEKEHVEEIFELVEENDGEETDDAISLVVDFVIWNPSEDKVKVVEFYCPDLRNALAQQAGSSLKFRNVRRLGSFQNSGTLPYESRLSLLI